MNMLQTSRTYATYENAERALAKALLPVGSKLTDHNIRYLIASTPDGRFAPVLVGQQFISFAVNANITVVG